MARHRRPAADRGLAPVGTADVRLRDVRDDDLAIFFEHQQDPDANRMANFDARDRDAFMAHWTKNTFRDETVVVRTVEFEGLVAGNIVSWEHDGERDVGYWIGREHWGRGIATGALSAFLYRTGDATAACTCRRPQPRVDPRPREVRLREDIEYVARPTPAASRSCA